MKSPWPSNKLLRTLKFIWSIPCGLIGLLIGGIVVVCSRTSIREIHEGAIDIVVGGEVAAWFNRHNWGGFTFGWTILYWGFTQYDVPHMTHERVHVRQFSNYGIAYPFVYGYHLLTKGYNCNPFEVQAYREAGQGESCPKP